ncbi:MAG: Skp family chaperone for outer membrane protein [Crocinitomicaceae bacterium]|jgi:Skp family chaperone for outer membrane proteins
MKLTAVTLLILLSNLFISNSVYSQEKQKIGDLTMAFYKADSIVSEIEYFRVKDSIFTAKLMAFQNKIEAENLKLNEYSRIQQAKLEKGLLTDNEVAHVQSRIQAMQGNILKTQEAWEKASLEAQDEHLEILITLSEIHRKYSEKNKIDVLIKQERGLSFGYINPSMDVTDDFMKFANEEFNKLEKEKE